MIIHLNGEEVEVEEGLTIAALLDKYRINRQRVVVEHNRRILHRPDHEKVTLAAGDKVEVVHFVGGG